MAVYDIEADKIPEQGQRFKCVECGHIWMVLPEDMNTIEPENKPKTQIIIPSEEENKDDDIQEMFHRLSQNTDNLFAGTEKYTIKIAENSNYTKQAHLAIDRETEIFGILKRKMQVFFAPLFLNGLLICLIAAFVLYLGYYNRYDVVRFIPAMENVYDNMHIESVHYAQNLVFDQLAIKQIQRGRKHFIEISGRLYNQGRYKAKLLPIKAVMLDTNGNIIKEDIKTMVLESLAPNASVLFFFTLENQTTDAKRIQLSFVENKK